MVTQRTLRSLDEAFDRFEPASSHESYTAVMGGTVVGDEAYASRTRKGNQGVLELLGSIPPIEAITYLQYRLGPRSSLPERQKAVAILSGLYSGSDDYRSTLAQIALQDQIPRESEGSITDRIRSTLPTFKDAKLYHAFGSYKDAQDDERLASRVYHILHESGIQTLGDLEARKHEIGQLKGMGPKGESFVENLLAYCHDLYREN